jgi:hypothetical protein
MCDYSLETVRSRPAKIGEKLTTQHFTTGTIGFAAPEDTNTAVCLLPGTELAFAAPVWCSPRGLLAWKPRVVNHTTAIFRQINKDKPYTHHDAWNSPTDRWCCSPSFMKVRKPRCSSFRRNLSQRPK